MSIKFESVILNMIKILIVVAIFAFLLQYLFIPIPFIQGLPVIGNNQSLLEIVLSEAVITFSLVLLMPIGVYLLMQAASD